MRSPRIILLFALLFFEIALIVSLRRVGWFGTGDAIHLIACLVATILPLGIAGALLVANRGRFSLRSLLAFIAFVAIFLYVSAVPLVDFYAARGVSKRLVAANATLDINSPLVDFYAQLGFDPRPTSSPVRSAKLLPWLQPLTGNASAIPADHSVREICINSDAQIQILCGQPARFESLEGITISAGVTPHGMVLLQETLPIFQQLVSVHVNDVAVPDQWYTLLRNIHTLFVWAEGPLQGSALKSSDLHDIAALSNLQVFMVLGYGVNDSDTKILVDSKSLKHIVFRRTAVTASGETALADAMPNCVVHRD